MTKNKDLQSVYFRFLNLVRSVDQMSVFPKLDATETELLNHISTDMCAYKVLLIAPPINMGSLVRQKCR